MIGAKVGTLIIMFTILNSDVKGSQVAEWGALPSLEDLFPGVADFMRPSTNEIILDDLEPPIKKSAAEEESEPEVPKSIKVKITLPSAILRDEEKQEVYIQVYRGYNKRDPAAAIQILEAAAKYRCQMQMFSFSNLKATLAPETDASLSQKLSNLMNKSWLEKTKLTKKDNLYYITANGLFALEVLKTYRLKMHELNKIIVAYASSTNGIRVIGKRVRDGE